MQLLASEVSADYYKAINHCVHPQAQHTRSQEGRQGLAAKLKPNSVMLKEQIKKQNLSLLQVSTSNMLSTSQEHVGTSHSGTWFSNSGTATSNIDK